MTNDPLKAWAARHGVTDVAMSELAAIFEGDHKPVPTGPSEASVQSQIVLMAPKLNASLWRNNSGACEDKTGRLIRYGLGHVSKRLNLVWKSADLIGITPVHHAGRTFGVFTAVECKPPGWTTDSRAEAQGNFLKNVAALGGIALFACDTAQYQNEVNKWRA